MKNIPFWLWMHFTAVIVRFYCPDISGTLARRGVQRGATEASGSGKVQRVWAW